jgi:hypothetical protein
MKGYCEQSAKAIPKTLAKLEVVRGCGRTSEGSTVPFRLS